MLGRALWERRVMLGRALWERKPRFGQRGGGGRHRFRFLAVVISAIAAAAAALLALLFVDQIESWTTTMRMNAAAEPEPHVASVLPPGGDFLPPGGDFLLTPSPLVCQRAEPYLIVMVMTAPHHRTARQAIRGSWGGGGGGGGEEEEEKEKKGLRVVTLFVVGEASEPGLAERLAEEARQHGDLVQGRFLDSYANLTLKTLSMLDWVGRFCPQARFVAKVDDDVFFNPGALLRLLEDGGGGGGDLYLGHVHHGVVPIRDDPASKHYHPSSAAYPPVYPDYCSGTAYVLSRAALLKMSPVAAAAAAGATLSYPLPPEDVFVGTCARAAGVLPTHTPLVSGGPGVPYGRCCYQAMVAVHHTAPGDMLRYWADSRSPPPCSPLGMRASLALCKVRSLLGAVLGVEQWASSL